MRKSPDNTSTKKLINYLLAGILLFVPSSNFTEQSNPDDAVKCESCKKTRERMLEKFKKIQESAPKKAKSNESEDNNSPNQLDLDDCEECQFA